MLLRLGGGGGTVRTLLGEVGRLQNAGPLYPRGKIEATSPTICYRITICYRTTTRADPTPTWAYGIRSLD